ncbi:MFS transporter permease [Pseudomonas agarici]|uniref:MFS transporter permease n=2 Tax=Pseudomonas agarici TaxID=46677 RepID=A0A0X1T4L0_PSEAA|nr:MFS transporter permease [Pseudomonas agarici]
MADRLPGGALTITKLRVNIMDAPQVQSLERMTMRQITWRLLPFLMLCYFVSYIDRINVGFAALQMRGELKLTAQHFGLGASLFLITYCLFAVPANTALRRFGPRRWIASMMVVWGSLAMGMALIEGPYSFYGFRLLLGAAEAGFLPGVIYYIARWFPKEYRAGISALFLVAIPASSFVGAPLSGTLMQLHGWHGLSGWQWLFLLEGLPAVLLAGCCLRVLPDTPAEAHWLSVGGRDWLIARLEHESRDHKAVGRMSVWQTLRSGPVLTLCLIYSGVISVGISLSLWQPQIINGFGLNTLQNGLLSSVPFGLATVAMVIWGRRSDKHNERTWHTAIPLALSGMALAASPFVDSLAGTILILSLALIGTYAAKGPFWAMVTQWLPAERAATGIAVVSAMGGLSASITTYLLGAISASTGSFTLALMPLVVLAALGTAALFLANAGKSTCSLKACEAGKSKC